MYFFRVKNQSFVKYDSRPGSVTYTDNYYLFLVVFNDEEIKKVEEEILKGLEYEVFQLVEI